MEQIAAAAFDSRQEWVERAPRAMATLLVGKLCHDNGAEQLCRVRNISETGMQIETVAALADGMPIGVELRGGASLSGTVVWTKENRAGVQFDAPIDVVKILGRPAAAGRGARPRSPRFTANIPARISSYGRSIDVTVADVSQGGACLQLQRPLRIDSEVILLIPGLPPRRCTTRWSDEELAGVAFHDAFSYNELSAWLDRMPAGA